MTDDLSAAPTAVTTAPVRYPIDFTGSGSEYFRIWIVNLLFIVVTVGIYSAWAKVRKLQYFYRNTQLAGAAFDFHGSQLKILLGRVIAVALFVAYNYSFQFSPWAALAAIGMALVAAPWLVQRAIRFKHVNSSYRGLRFGFTGTTAQAYGALGPAVALVLLPSTAAVVLQLLGDGGTVWPVLVASAALLLLYPWLHFRFKRFHHGHARYGALAGQFSADWDDFYKVYFPLVIILIGWMALLIALMFGVFQLIGPVERGAEPSLMQLALIYAAVMLAYGLLLVSVAPFMVSRLQNLIWGRTTLGPIGFDSALRFGPTMRLYLKNAVLIALTLGLYWPWAAVAVAKLRLAAVTVVAPVALDDVIGSADDAGVAATGDAAADVFGFDIGL